VFPPEETIKVPGAYSCCSITFPVRSLRHTVMIPLEGAEVQVAATGVGIQSYQAFPGAPSAGRHSSETNTTLSRGS